MTIEPFVEDSISVNNMIINAKRIDETIYHNNRIRFLRKIKEIAVKPIGFVRHAAKLRDNGFQKTCLLCSADLRKSIIQDYGPLGGFDHQYELQYVFKNPERPRIAVYTSIFGGYDAINEPLYSNGVCDYYIITDLDIPQNSIWKRLSIPDDEVEKMDGYHKSKWCKMHPHVLFPEYDFSIWIDGNIQVAADLSPIIDRFSDSCSMATFQNPLHDCIYTEANYCIYRNAVNMDQINEQVGKYRSEGFPKHFGMREFSVIARRHNDERLIGLMEEWWSEVNAYTMRDQISFPYILWKNGLDIEYIQVLGANWRENPRFIYVPHNWRHEYKR